MKCKRCNGFGYWFKSTGWREDQEEKVVCEKCNGTGFISQEKEIQEKL